MLSSFAQVQEGDRRLPLRGGGGLFVLGQEAGHPTYSWRHIIRLRLCRPAGQGGVPQGAGDALPSLPPPQHPPVGVSWALRGVLTRLSAREPRLLSFHFLYWAPGKELPTRLSGLLPHPTSPSLLAQLCFLTPLPSPRLDLDVQLRWVVWRTEEKRSQCMQTEGREEQGPNSSVSEPVAALLAPLPWRWPLNGSGARAGA